MLRRFMADMRDLVHPLIDAAAGLGGTASLTCS